MDLRRREEVRRMDREMKERQRVKQEAREGDDGGRTMRTR